MPKFLMFLFLFVGLQGCLDPEVGNAPPSQTPNQNSAEQGSVTYPLDPISECLHWYDGCNTCTRDEEDETLVICTKRYCEEPDGEAVCFKRK